MAHSNTQKIRNLFFHLLQDGKNHTAKEIYDLIMRSADIHIMNSNTVYSTLYNIRKSSDSNYFIRNHDGSYRLKPYLLEPENKALLLQLTQEEEPDANLPDTLTINEVVERWTSLCTEINARLKQPDYEMSEKEFIKYKQIHLLNKKIQELLNDFISTEQ